MADIVWHIAYNMVRQPCGCADWMQFVRGEWCPGSWRCNRHNQPEVSSG